MSLTANVSADLSALANNAMEQGNVRHVLAMAEGQLKELLQQRATILRRITTLRRTLSGLTEIFGHEASDGELMLAVSRQVGRRKTGLTDACRSVVMNSNLPLTPQEVVTKIRSTDDGLLRNHRNAVASVTSILYRLQSYGEAAASATASGKRAWAWKK